MPFLFMNRQYISRRKLILRNHGAVPIRLRKLRRIYRLQWNSSIRVVDLSNSFKDEEKTGEEKKPKDEESKEEEMKVDEAVDTKEKTDTEEKPVHNREKPFQCNQCDHCASQNSNLKMPIITVHNKEKPFSTTSVIPRRLLQCVQVIFNPRPSPMLNYLYFHV